MASVTGFVYDGRDRLESRTDPLGKFETYVYDANGNLEELIDRKGQMIEFQYDDINRLKKKIMEPGTANEVVRDFGYDPAGNLDSIIDPSSGLAFTCGPLNHGNRMT